MFTQTFFGGKDEMVKKERQWVYFVTKSIYSWPLNKKQKIYQLTAKRKKSFVDTA